MGISRVMQAVFSSHLLPCHRRPLWPVWCCLALLIACKAFMMFLDIGTWEERGWVGPYNNADSWLRLERAAILAEEGDWYDRVIERIDPPHGMVSPWTRPLDVVALVMAQLAPDYMDVREALVWWSQWHSLFLHTLCLIALLWAIRPLCLSALSQSGALILFTFEPYLFHSVAETGSVDHHSLIALFYIGLMGAALRITSLPGRKRVAMLAGILAGMGIWISVEMTVAALLVYLWLALNWIHHPKERIPWARSLLLYAATALAALVAAFLIERGTHGWETVWHDSLSIVHLTLFLLLGLSAVAVTRLWVTGTVAGWAVMAFLGVITVSIMLWLFPDAPLGPMAHIDAALRNDGNIYELRHGWHYPAGWPLLLLTSAAGLLLSIRCLPGLPEPVIRRQGMLLLYLTACFFLLTAYQLRWFAYGFTGFVLLALLTDIHTLRTRQNGASRFLISLILVTVTLTGFHEYRMLTHDPALPAHVCRGQQLREIQAGLAWLREDTPQHILAYDDIPAQILFWTPHASLMSNFHRNTVGSHDGHAILDAKDDARARALIEERGVDYIYLCETGSFLPGSFAARLLSGHRPSWLETVGSEPGKDTPLRLRVHDD